MNRVLVPLALLATCLLSLWAADRLGSPASADDSAAVESTVDPLQVPILSARRLPESLKAPMAIQTLQRDTEAVLENSPVSTCLVITDKTGVPLIEKNAASPLVPASTQKLVTAVAALLQLGDDYRFTTSLMSPDGISDGGRVGDLYLVGGGDPVIMTSDYISSFRDLTIFTDPGDLVKNLSDAGVVAIDGQILGVGNRYDDERYPAAWPSRFAEQGQSGPLSALMINDAFVQWPPTPEEREDAPQLGVATSESPETHAASIIRDLLEASGIPSAGASSAGAEVDVNGMETIASIESPPLGDIVAEMLEYSDNTTAELLTKELGLVVNNAVGTTQSGTDAIVEILAENGMGDLRILNLIDGSGLSEENRLECNQLVGVLNQSITQPLLQSVLPVAGETGTLFDRFLTSAARGKMSAKTGSLINATALAGYVVNADDDVLTFAYIANTDESEAISDELKAEQEPLGDAMAEFPAGPAIADIAPPGEERRPTQTIVGATEDDATGEPTPDAGSLSGGTDSGGTASDGTDAGGTASDGTDSDSTEGGETGSDTGDTVDNG